MEEGSEDYDKGWPMNAREFGPPCVGLCHYFRENNITNPGYKFQHTGKEIDFGDEPIPLGKPCVGRCHYFRENNIINLENLFQHTRIVDEPSLEKQLPSSLAQNMSTCVCD